jgi:Na+-translocating ferredoxin:NAD+ oxidoreductase RnfC subunit
MIGEFIGTLMGRISIGISIALLILVGDQTARLSSAHSTIATQALQLKAITAERDRFEADAARMVQEGIERTARRQQALKEQAPRSVASKRQADRIRAAAPTTNCKTAREVLDADL